MQTDMRAALAALLEVTEPMSGKFVFTAERAGEVAAIFAAARAALAAPPQEQAEPVDRWCVVCQAALDVGLGDDVRTGGRPEFGYSLIADAATFATEEEARTALQSAGLPLGWVVIPLSRLLPDVAASPKPAQAEPDAKDAEIHRLRTALRFYARGEHYHLDESEEFDTVSGEPQNWLCSGREDSATMIENGRVAMFALQGIDANWIDGDEDSTPQPIDSEVSCAAAPKRTDDDCGDESIHHHSRGGDLG